MNSRVLGGLCAIAAFGLDQGTKALALNTPAVDFHPELTRVFHREVTHL